MTIAALKKELKSLGLSQSGEKSDLQRRLELHAQGEKHKLPDGRNPCSLPAGQLKKTLAVRGLPCDTSIETRDELLARLIETLKAEGGGSTGEAGGLDAGGGAQSSSDDARDDIALAVQVAKQVLELGEGGDYAAVLSLAGAAVSRATPFGQLRKAYHNLARIIHPDKLGSHFDQATRAFQELIRAFDAITAPEPPAEKPGKKDKAGPTLARSNQNCFRTRLWCPRCDAEWATADAGLDKYEYNLMMQGLKTFCCARCLCEFGCVTARHACPLCKKRVEEYHYQDYHRQVQCTHKKCGGTYGFWLYTVPPRVEAQLRADLKVQQEQRLKAREAKAARLARAQRKQPALSEAQVQKQAERLFLRNLLDACPRCGFEPSPGADKDSLQAHLSACVDKVQHQQYKRVQQAEAGRRERKQARHEEQEEVANAAAWQYLGGETSSMWMLTDKQLAKQCKDAGITAKGGREDMLAALAETRAQREGQGLLTEKGGAGDGSGGVSRRRGGAISRESLPENLHAMSLAQLRAVCAAHGLKPQGSSVDEIIKGLEAKVYSADEPLLLE